MNREDAEHRAAELTAEHPDRTTHRFLARHGSDGEWAVVKIGLPPVDETRITGQRADEKPVTPDDPRQNAWQNVPPFGPA